MVIIGLVFLGLGLDGKLTTSTSKPDVFITATATPVPCYNLNNLLSYEAIASTNKWFGYVVQGNSTGEVICATDGDETIDVVIYNRSDDMKYIEITRLSTVLKLEAGENMLQYPTMNDTIAIYPTKTSNIYKLYEGQQQDNNYTNSISSHDLVDYTNGSIVQLPYNTGNSIVLAAIHKNDLKLSLISVENWVPAEIMNAVDFSGSFTVRNNLLVAKHSDQTLRVFKQDSVTKIWEFKFTLIPPIGSTTSWGSSMTVSNNGLILMVGDPNQTVNNLTNAGQVYLYTRTTVNDNFFNVQTITEQQGFPLEDSFFGKNIELYANSAVFISGNQSAGLTRLFYMYKILQDNVQLQFQQAIDGNAGGAAANFGALFHVDQQEFVDRIHVVFGQLSVPLTSTEAASNNLFPFVALCSQ
jgi:hypothetical protein